jgi:hypothetical protein
MLQQQSVLLRLPTELRHEIIHYLTPNQLHVRVRDQSFVLSPCVVPVKTGSEDEGRRSCADILHEIQTIYESAENCCPTNDPIWMRRLQSRWGLHCRCEEITSGGDHNAHQCASLLLVCNIM